MTNCNCDCHKVKDKSDLKKCQENSKKKTREINELRKKLLVVTIALAVGGTLIGKESLDKVLEYFQSFDKVKKAIDNVGYVPDSDTTIPLTRAFPPH